MNKRKLLAIVLSLCVLSGNTGLLAQTAFANDSSNIGGITMEEIDRINSQNEDQDQEEENGVTPIVEEPSDVPIVDEPSSIPPEEETVPDPQEEDLTEPAVDEPFMAMALAATVSEDDFQKLINDAVNGTDYSVEVELEGNLKLTKSIEIPLMTEIEELVIELNGHTIEPASTSDEPFPLISVEINDVDSVKDLLFRTLTIQNGTLDGAEFSQGIRIVNDDEYEYDYEEDEEYYYFLEHIYLNDIIIKNCVSDSDGAGIYYSSISEYEANLDLNNVTLDNNDAEGNGGGLYINGNCCIYFDYFDEDDDEDDRLNNFSVISNNEALNGGGIYALSNGYGTIDFCGAEVPVTGNHAKENGGAIYTNFSINMETRYDGGPELMFLPQEILFDANEATNGGAVYLAARGEFRVGFQAPDYSASFTNNKAINGSGGFLFMEHNSRLELYGDECDFFPEDNKEEDSSMQISGNEATVHGGAIATGNTYFCGDEGIDIWLTYVNIFDNHAGENGGALYIEMPDMNDPFDCDVNCSYGCDCCWDGGCGTDCECGLDYVMSPSIKIVEVSIADNTAGEDGGGLYFYVPKIIDDKNKYKYNEYYNLKIELDSLFVDGNTAENNGGGLYISNPNNAAIADKDDGDERDYFTISDFTLCNNTAKKDGGGLWNNTILYLEQASDSVNASLIDDNHAENGGGIYNEGYVGILYTEIINNDTTNDGAGIYNKGCVNLNYVEEVDYHNHINIRNNEAAHDGGGIYNLRNLTVAGSWIDEPEDSIVFFTSNTAGNCGGGVYSGGYMSGEEYISGNFSIPYSRFKENTALDGGGLYYVVDDAKPAPSEPSDPCGTCDLPNFGCGSPGSGCGDPSTTDYMFYNLIFDTNGATARGGGIFFNFIEDNLAVDIWSNTFTGNEAFSGGAIYTTSLEQVFIPAAEDDECGMPQTTSFEENEADSVYNPSDEEIGIHEDHIFVVPREFSVAGHNYAYNNFDINGTQLYTVTVICNNGTASANPVVASANTNIDLSASATNSGYKFSGWSSADPVTFGNANATDTSFTMPAQDVTVIATFTKIGGNGGGGTTKPKPKPEEAVVPTLDKENHFAYIFGYPDDTVRPENNISRTEVTAIFYRLLTTSSRDAYFKTTNNFPDVATDKWYTTAVSTMANAEIVSGYEDGLFRGDNYITRAEFASIAARFDSDTYSGDDKFADISGHWAANHINRAAQKGWISGYPDGTFKPDQYITRAEAVTLINRVLERDNVLKMLDGMITWTDNQPSAWYYVGMQEAGNGHDYVVENSGEYWTDLDLGNVRK